MRNWLPVLAATVVGKDGRVVFVHTDPNSRERLPIDDLLTAVETTAK